jgi:CheY-like chemotaxis protein
MNVKTFRQKIQTNNSQAPIILVVEDDADNLLFIAHTLIFFQYNFITTTKGQAALDLATQYHVDLILLDLVLSDLDGLELVRLLKKNQLTQNIPIIAISALVRKQDREQALAAGCNDYLNKPYLIDDLDRKVCQYLPQSSINYPSAIVKQSHFSILSAS